MVRLLKIAALAAAVIAMLLAGTVLLGAVLWRSPEVLFSDGCGMPCWWSIRPGETTLDEAIALLGDALPGVEPMAGVGGYTLSYTLNTKQTQTMDFDYVRVLAADDMVQTLFLEPVRGLTFGDVAAALGPPAVMYAGGEALYPGFGLRLVVAGCCCSLGYPLTPTMRVRMVAISPAWESGVLREKQPWRGWGSVRYCPS